MNIIYFNNSKLKNKNIITLNINIKINNIYTWDYFDVNKRKKILNYLFNKINNKNPVIIYSLCKTTVSSILYINELRKNIDNKIYLILLAPLLTLRENNYNDKSGFGKGHSIHKIFNKFIKNNEYENIVNEVFSNKKINKICLYSENDPTLPKKFNTKIFEISHKLINLKFLNIKLHNFFSLFYYCYSKNFEKLKKINHYINENELKLCSSIWKDDLTIEKLSKCIITNNYNIFNKYKFIKINYY